MASSAVGDSGGGGGGSAPAARRTDWSNIPSELLLLAAQKGTTVSDYIRFRSVCRSWRLAAAPAYLPPQLPLLMLPSDPSADVRHFFSLSARKAFPVSMPGIRGKAVVNSAGGWLLVYEPSFSVKKLQKLSLLNPITGAEFHLPSTSGFQDNSSLKAWYCFLSCKPNSGGDDCIVMLANCRTGSGGAVFCRARDTAWTVLETGLDEGEIVVSMAYFDGRFYAITEKGKISVCDPAAPLSPTVMMFSTEMASFTSLQFVARDTGLFVLVGHRLRDAGDGREKESFVAFKLHLVDGLHCKRQICGVEDAAVFMSNHQVMLVPAKEIPGCRANHIYCSHFFDLHYHRDLEKLKHVQGIWLLDLGNLDYQIEHMSCGWRILREALYEPRFVLEPRRLAYALRHRFPLSRWVALSLS